MALKTILFEPWGLGDAIIAAAVLRECGPGTALMCDPRWHPLIKAAFAPQEPHLLAIDLPYAKPGQGRRGFWSLEVAALDDMDTVNQVLSPRGDPRDYMAAQRLFPRARIRMSGMVVFPARRFSWYDLPFRQGWMPVHSRYSAWLQLAGIPGDALRLRQAENARRDAAVPGKTVIHVGARWRTKQYPWAAALYKLIEERNYQVSLVAAPGDVLPEDVEESRVRRLVDDALVCEMSSAEWVVTNDSGPMHLAAFLGCRTVAIIRASNPREWGPPGVALVLSKNVPRGYRAASGYNSDRVLDGWPDPEDVAAVIPHRSNKPENRSR